MRTYLEPVTKEANTHECADFHLFDLRFTATLKPFFDGIFGQTTRNANGYLFVLPDNHLCGWVEDDESRKEFGNLTTNNSCRRFYASRLGPATQGGVKRVNRNLRT